MAIKKIAIDTNVYSGISKGTINHQLIFDQYDEIIIPTIVIGELRAGFVIGNKARKNKNDLQKS